MQEADYKVKEKFLIRGPDRTSSGHPYYFRAGRGWTKNWLQVSVVEGTEDPQKVTIDEKTGEASRLPILDMINQAQLNEILADDKNMVVRPIDMGTGDAANLKIDVPALIKNNAEQAAEIAKLKGELRHTQGKLADAQALLDEVTKPAAKVRAQAAASGGQRKLAGAGAGR